MEENTDILPKPQSMEKYKEKKKIIVILYSIAYWVIVAPILLGSLEWVVELFMLNVALPGQILIFAIWVFGIIWLWYLGYKRILKGRKSK